ncbi:MAG: peptidoglycan-binding domain-containing protein [Motiliproteus sp.]
MRQASFGLMVVLLFQAQLASGIGLIEIRELWHQQNYKQVITELLQYRDTDFGKTVEVDYMLATSFCRHPGDDDLGRAFLLNILQVYELSKANREAIGNERNHCPEQSQPEQMAFLTLRSTGGADAGVRGKMFYFVDGPNRAIGGDPLKARKIIDEKELLARKYIVGTGNAAAEAMAQRLSQIGYQPKVHLSAHFVIGSMSGHTPEQMKEIARLLERALAFYITHFEMRAPSSYVSVYLLPDGVQLRTIGDKLHGLEVARGTIGYSFRNDLSVSAVVNGPYTGTLKHELTHLLVRSNFGDIPPWLDEGLAALYEVSRLEGDFLRGLPNWREEVLKRYWNGKPSVSELLGMNWKQFDAQEGSMKSQAVQHALARYWLLYLQDQGYLDDVYAAYRTRDIRQTTTNPVADAAMLIASATGKSLEVLDAEFRTWFNVLNRQISRDEVMDIQRRLAFLGYSPGKADGFSGPNTRQAVKKFQRDNGLDDDGKINTALLGLIKSKTGK